MASWSFRTITDQSSGEEYFEWIRLPTVLHTPTGEKPFVAEFPRWTIASHSTCSRTGTQTFVLKHGEAYKSGGLIGGKDYTVTITVPRVGHITVLNQFCSTQE